MIWQFTVTLTFVIAFARSGICVPTDASFFISSFLSKYIDTDAASDVHNAFVALSKCSRHPDSAFGSMKLPTEPVR